MEITRPDLFEKRAGVLCNPGAGRARGRLERIRSAAAALPGGIYRETGDAESMHAALVEFRAARVAVIVVIGGDGTLHAVLSECLRARPAADQPCFVPVPGGTTNMNATDLGVHGQPDEILGRLQKLFTNPLYPPRVRRPVLSIRSSEGMAHGMFFGGGIIADGVRHFSEHVRGRGLTGEMLSGWVMLRHLSPLAVGRLPDSLPVKLVRREDDGAPVESEALLFLATTLERLLLGARPYWGLEPAAMRCTTVDYPPGRLWTVLPALYRGNAAALQSLPAYRSRNLRRLELELDGDYVIDGEVYTASRARGPLVITPTEPLNFLSP